jgi:hypothetical protein
MAGSASLDQDAAAKSGPSAMVAALIGWMPRADEAKTADWHWAFWCVRDTFKDRLGELGGLHFHQRPGLPPISDELQDIMQSMAMWGLMAHTREGTAVDAASQARLQELTVESIAGREAVVKKAARELQHQLDLSEVEMEVEPAWA